MSKANELKDSVNRENERINEDLMIAREYANLIPQIEEKKKESEVKLYFVDNTLDDILEEIAPQLLPYQKIDEQRINDTPFAKIPLRSTLNLSIYSATSGSVSAFDQASRAISLFPPQSEEWAPKVRMKFSALAEEKSRKDSIPEKLDKLNHNLGRMFLLVHDNYYKAKNGTTTVSGVAMDMRGVIQQLWGGLVNLAREKCPDCFRNIQHVQFKKPAHRLLVAQSIARAETDIDSIQAVLERIYSLDQAISPSEFGKNPLSEDLNMLEEIRTSWILQIDDLLDLVLNT